jgi:hypothetical protein
MSSENPSGADNQQETAEPCVVLEANWIVGFVDGEGCFCVSVHRNSFMHRHRGWQLQPSFHVYQHQQHRMILEAFAHFFGCGRVRPKGPNSAVLTYSVEALRDLEVVIDFFEKHPLLVKQSDFLAFAEVVRAMRRKEHLTDVGFERLVRLAYGMNAHGKQRSRSMDSVLAGSSETAREAPASNRLGVSQAGVEAG